MGVIKVLSSDQVLQWSSSPSGFCWQCLQQAERERLSGARIPLPTRSPATSGVSCELSFQTQRQSWPWEVLQQRTKLLRVRLQKFKLIVESTSPTCEKCPKGSGY